MRVLLLAVGALGLAACAGRERAVGPGPVATPHFEFALAETLTRIPLGADPELNAEQYTRHGPLLDRLMITRLKDGEGLLTPGFDAYPRWWRGTPADGLDGFLSESLVRLGYEAVEVESRTARAFAGGPGVLYTLRLSRPGGLEMRGLAFAAVDGGALDLMIFLAPRDHYFEARLGGAEAVFSSARRR